MRKSILHWIGGKNRLLPQIIENLPVHFNDYYEPFLGSGVVFINLKKEAHTTSYINDFNVDVINVFNQIREDPQKVIQKLQYLSRTFNRLRPNERKEYFLSIRKKINKLKGMYTVKRAALYIFLNKTCFNGFMQCNRKGELSVSFGHFKDRNPNIVQTKDVKYLSQLLSAKTYLSNDDYEILLRNAKKGDFVFLDPPYVPDAKVKYTVKYQKNGMFSTTREDGWNEQDFDRVCKVYKELHKKGCFVMMTNYNTKFIRDNFPEDKFSILKIQSKRKLTSKIGRHKSLQTEVIITNY